MTVYKEVDGEAGLHMDTEEIFIDKLFRERRILNLPTDWSNKEITALENNVPEELDGRRRKCTS